ncbi:hypothetical protein D3C81_1621050 [compost metagenome]
MVPHFKVVVLVFQRGCDTLFFGTFSLAWTELFYGEAEPILLYVILDGVNDYLLSYSNLCPELVEVPLGM